MTLSRDPGRDEDKEAQAPSLVTARPRGVATFQACVERVTDVRAAGLLRRAAGRENAAASKPRLRFFAALAPLLLAAYTVVAAAGAVLALAPAALARGPLGRRRTPRGVAPTVAASGGEAREARGAATPVPASAAEEREALGS
jgi:hypothetical protein